MDETATPITVAESKSRRKELEKSVSRLFESFEHETGLNITAIRWNPMSGYAVSHPSAIGDGEKVDIDVSL